MNIFSIGYIHIPYIFFYCKKGVIPASNYISDEMKNKGYEVINITKTPPKKREKKKLIEDRKTEKNILTEAIRKIKLSKRDRIPTNNKDIKNTENLNTIDTMNYNKEIDTQNDVVPRYNIIKLKANNSSKYTPLNSNYELDNYEYSEAILHEKSSFCRIFFIYFIRKENILNKIYFNTPLELKPLRICIFF